MDNRILIQGIIDYIEANLASDICIYELADMAGYSYYHFLRLFKSYTGMSVKHFIDRRKLLHASYEISSGDFAIEVALKYGYDSYSGFYRAFVREFGSSPSVFSSVKQNKPYRINLFKEEFMTVTIKNAKEILSVHWGIMDISVRNIFYPSSGNKSESGFYVGNELVLKYSANVGRVINDISLSSALQKGGLPSSVNIKTLAGEDYINNGEMFFYLTKRISGASMIASSFYDVEHFPDAEYAGSLIGRLDNILSEVDFPATECFLADKVRKYISGVKDILQLSEKFCFDYMKELSRLYDLLPKQVIHRDPNPGNIVGSGDLWGFVDFELSERNVRIYDICYAATAVLSETYDEKNPDMIYDWLKIYKAMISGYDKVVNMSDEEKEAVPYVILANQIVCIGYFSGYEKYRDIFLTNKEMTIKLIEIFEELKIK